jgi:hypothetical protein
MDEVIRFRSTRFRVEPGEDAEINPGIHGRQLADWLRARLSEAGETVEPVIAEDWGRCLVCRRDSFLLWIGCGNESGIAPPVGPPPAAEDIVWICFVVAEVPLPKRLFARPDTVPAVAALRQKLLDVLDAEPSITLLGDDD